MEKIQDLNVKACKLVMTKVLCLNAYLDEVNELAIHDYIYFMFPRYTTTKST